MNKNLVVKETPSVDDSVTSVYQAFIIFTFPCHLVPTVTKPAFHQHSKPGCRIYFKILGKKLSQS